MTFRARLRVLAALLAASCASDPTGGGELLVVSQIDVQPPGASVTVGASQQLSATPKTSSGITVPNRTVTWSSSDQGVATVSPSGLVTGVAVGPATITARVDDITADVTVNVTPKPVASVSVEPPQVALQVGGAQQLIATPRDAQGLPLQNRPVVFQSDNPSVASVSTTGLVLAITPGSTTIRATSEGRTGTSAVTVTPRPAARLGFTTQPANGTAGQALAPIRVAVQDDLGGTIPDAVTSITLSIADNAGGATLGGTVTVNAVAGVATFNNVVLDKSGAGYTLRASAVPLSPAISNAFTIAAAAASRLVLATQPSPTAQSGAPLAVQPVVQVADANGNPVAQAGVAVSVQIVGAGATLAGVLTVPTAADGRATFTGLSLTGTPGNYQLRFVATGFVEVVSNPIALTQGTPTGLLLLTPPSGTAVSGVPFAQQPVVQLRDGNNNPVAQAGVPVTVAPASGGGTLAGVLTVNTNASGQAAFAGLSLSGAAGVHTLAFSAPNLGQVVSPPITLTGGGAARLEIVAQPSSTASNGSPFLNQPSVQLFDAGGNQVAQGGVVVTASLPPGNAVTSGFVTATTNANGLAVFSNLSITGLVGTYRITFSAPDFASTESNDIVLGPGLASRLVFLTQPAGAANAQPLTQQPVLQLTDVSGNVVASAGVTVTAALASGPGTLGGTLVASTDASGIATFANLSITGAAGAYTIGFTAPGVVQVVSDPIGLGAGIPTQLGVTTQPSATAASGAVFAQQPVIQLRDASNNPVAQAGVTITAAIASGGGTLLGTVTANTNATGAATFTNLAISGIVGNRTLQFTATGLTTATSNTIAITPGSAMKLALTVQPSPTASSGDPFPQQPVVQVQDNEGNAVAQAGTAITAAIETGAGGTLGGGTLVITNGAGQAAFTNLALTGASGNYTLRFTGGGLTQVISNTIGLGAGAASKLAIATQPSASVQNGVAFPQQPAIQLQDGSNNPVAQAGVIITVTILSGNPALGGTLNATTNASGLATFTNLAITGLIGARTLIFAAGGFVSITSNAITVTPGAPAAIEFTTPPPAAAQSGALLSPQPVVHLEDQSGNLVSQAGVNVTASIASGGGTLGGTATVATNGSGVATFTNLSISGLIGIRTLAFNSAGLSGVTSGNITLSAGAASQLSITTQPGTPATNGSALPTQPQVQLRDAAGNAVSQAGVLITAVIGAGSPAGTLTNATATTDGAGLATFSGLTITGLVGTYTLQFTSVGLSSSPLSSGIVLGASGATQLSITTQPGAAAQSGIAIPTQPAIQLRDQSGNAVVTNGVTITAVIATNPGGTPSLTNATANTVSGVATFSGLAITGLIGNYTLQFTSGGLTPITSGTVTLSAGAAATLEVSTEPSAAAQSGIAFASQPVIRARDGAGNNVAGAVITASIASGPGGATLGGTLTATTVAPTGLATFGTPVGLSIAGLVGAYTLQFATPGATSVTSQTITLSAGAASKLVIGTQPSAAAQNDVNFPSQPVIQVTDAGGNPVTDNGINVTAAIASGGGAIGGTATVATVNGVATFTNLKITGTIGTRTLQFTAPSLDPVTSNNVAVSAGLATTIVMFQQPPLTVANGAVLTPAPAVDLQDVSGNDVDSAGVAIDVAIFSGGGTLGGTTPVATTGPNGRATFSDLTITGSPLGNRTLRFTHGALAPATSNLVGLTAGAPAALTITQQPAAAATNDVALAPAPIVQVTDGSGNPVANVNVTVSLLGGGTLSGAPLSVLTDGAGNANFSGLKIVGLAGTKNLRFTAGVLTVDSDDITLSAGAATALAITVQPSNAATENVAFAQQPTVELRDSGGNLVADNGVNIVAELVEAGTLNGTATVATVSGVSAFTDLSILAAGTYTIRFTSAGLSPIVSVQITVSP